MCSKTDWAIIVLLVLIGITIYANSFGGKFLWDNRFEIVENAYVKNFDLGNIFTHSITSGAGRESSFYRPLVALSFAVDYKIWGLRPWGFHLTNFLLHIFSAALIYFIFNLLYGRKVVSLFVSFLFTIHPTQVETVSYISGRSDLLMVFFSLLSIYFFVKYLRSSSRKFFYYAASILAFSLALLSKEIAVITPLLLILVYLFLNKERFGWTDIKNITLRMSPLLFLSLVYTILRLTILKFGGGFSTYSNLDIFSRSSIFIKSLLEYWKILLFPVNLRFRLDDVGSFAGNGQLVLSLAILAAIAYFLVLSFRKRGVIFFGFSWFFIALMPVSSMVMPINYILGERWLRLPAIGLFFLAVIGIQELFKRLSPHKFTKGILYAFIIAYFVLLSFITIKTNKIWSDPISFHSHLAKYYPYDIDNRLNLAISYKEAGQKESALKEYKTIIEHTEFYIKNERIVKNWEQLAKSYKLLGSLYSEFGQYNKSIYYLEKLQELVPEDWKPYSLLAQVYILKGNYEEAVKLLEKVLSIDSDNVRAKNYLQMLKNGQVPTI